jgi:hypothetical protein
MTERVKTGNYEGLQGRHFFHCLEAFSPENKRVNVHIPATSISIPPDPA